MVRFKGPLEGETVVDDLVKGPVRFQNKELDDLVLLRSDGAPTYNLAVVVDDHDMGVTHVIRGDDHLNNAARQSLIYEALGLAKPAFAHIPLIHGPDGAKLSKRHGAQAVGEFADMGYLPEAMRNYLARLGWGHGDDEIFSDAQAIAWFDVADVVRAPARLDWAKLNHVNNHYIRRADDDRLAALTADIHAGRGVSLHRRHPAPPAGRHSPGQGRGQDHAGAGGPDPVRAQEPAPGAGRQDRRPAQRRDRRPPPAPDANPGKDGGVDGARVGNRAEGFRRRGGVGLGKFGPALRGVLSGGATAPDLASSLAALGREESLGRLKDALFAGH